MKKNAYAWLTVAGIVVICAIIATMTLGSQRPAETPQAQEPPPAPSGTVVVAPILPTEGNNTTNEPPAPSKQGGGAQADSPAETGQILQPEATRPPELPAEQRTDPTRTPDGEVVSAPPAPVDHAAVPAPLPPTPSNTQPQGGEKQDGKLYVPGFGWIEDEGGGGAGTSADDMYENGNKVGNMG